MLRVNDIVCFIFLLAYISPSYLLLSSPGSLLAYARSLDLSEYQRDTHVLNYHRSRESSLLTFLLRDGHFSYEHLAVFYRRLITRKDVTTESDRSTEQECDDSRKTDRWKNREPTFRFRRLRIKGTAVGSKTLRRGSSENWHWTNVRGWLDVIFSNVWEWRTTDGQKNRRCEIVVCIVPDPIIASYSFGEHLTLYLWPFAISVTLGEQWENRLCHNRTNTKIS